MKKGKKKSLIITLICLTLVVVLGFLPCSAEEEYVCFANMDSSITYSYNYNNYNNFDTITKDYPENIQIPIYGTAEDESKRIDFNYNEVSFGGLYKDIVLDEITFDINFYDCILYDSTQYRFQVEYSMSPGRRTKLSLQGLEEGFITVYTNQEHTESYTVDFSDIDLITEKITQPNIASYKYTLDFTIEPKKDTIIYAVNVVTSNILVEQELMTTNGNSVIIGLNKAIITGFNEEEANQNNAQYIKDESNRIDNELNNLTEDMVVPTPNPDELLEQTDPFEIIDKNEFNNISNDLQIFIGENPIFIGMITITFMFVLFKYVLFGKG